MRVEPPPLGEELRDALGSPAVVRRLSSSPRSRVWLAEFDGSPAIIKQISGGADAGERFAREVTALRLARRVRPFVVPGVLGTDPGERVMVLEYLAELAQAPAPDWMAEYAAALARLHAATGPDDAGALPAWAGPSRADARAFIRLAERLGVVVPAGLTASLDGLAQRLNPAGQHALLHGDPCPGNVMRTASGIMFVDLEQAALGDGRVELAYPRIAFPTCWCAKSVPGPVLRQAEAAYRSTWHAVTGTEAGANLAEACAGWLIRGDALVERADRGRSRCPSASPRPATAPAGPPGSGCCTASRWSPDSARTTPGWPAWRRSAWPCGSGSWPYGLVWTSFRSPTTIPCAAADGGRAAPRDVSGRRRWPLFWYLTY